MDGWMDYWVNKWIMNNLRDDVDIIDGWMKKLGWVELK